jgi:hypothetical protein
VPVDQPADGHHGRELDEEQHRGQETHGRQADAVVALEHGRRRPRVGQVPGGPGTHGAAGREPAPLGLMNEC